MGAHHTHLILKQRRRSALYRRCYHKCLVPKSSLQEGYLTYRSGA